MVRKRELSEGIASFVREEVYAHVSKALCQLFCCSDELCEVSGGRFGVHRGVRGHFTPLKRELERPPMGEGKRITSGHVTPREEAPGVDHRYDRAPLKAPHLDVSRRHERRADIAAYHCLQNATGRNCVVHAGSVAGVSPLSKPQRARAG